MNRDWVKYEDGFGDLNGEFWIGLRSMHCLTSQGNWELRIDYKLKNGTESYLYYNKFAIGSAEDQYPLNTSGFDSIGLTDPFDSGHPLTGMKFTSRDRDNDLNGSNCAQCYGGWWHNDCNNIRLNNKYNQGLYGLMYINGEILYPTFVEMKIRPQNCEID